MFYFLLCLKFAGTNYDVSKFMKNKFQIYHSIRIFRSCSYLSIGDHYYFRGCLSY